MPRRGDTPPAVPATPGSENVLQEVKCKGHGKRVSTRSERLQDPVSSREPRCLRSALRPTPHADSVDFDPPEGGLQVVMR